MYKLLSVVFIIGMLLWAGFLFKSNNNPSVLTVKNDTHDVVKTVEIKVCNQLFKLENILPGEERLIRYRIRGDSHYDFFIKFNSQRVLEKSIGYVTSGMIIEDLAIIKNDEVVLENKSLEIP